MIYLIKIYTYIFIGTLIYLVGGKRTGSLRFTMGGQPLSNREDTRISWISIILFSAILGWYSTIVSKIPYSSDRGNYVYRFINYWKNPWTWGLNSVGEFVHLFSNDPNAFFFTVTFLSTVLFLAAYRISREGKPEALLLLVSSNCLIYSFYLCKQGPAMAFGAVAIVLLLKKKYFYVALFTLGAIAFHESAYILIPLYGLLLFSSKKGSRIVSYIAMAVALFLFAGLTRFFSGFIQRYIPDLFSEAEGYVNYISAGGGANLATVFKGFPYYIITIYAFYRRNALKSSIPSYDLYLTMCFFASICSMLSFVMYWMWRFGAYCYFPAYIFASELYAVNPFRSEAKAFLLIIAGALAFLMLRYLYQMFFWYGGF